ncbi:MAG: hypothetical protein ABI051_02145 [Vicinamibacterales bacterium]
MKLERRGIAWISLIAWATGVVILSTPGRASAQLSLPGPLITGLPAARIGHDIAYDPAQNILLAVGTSAGIRGRFLDSGGGLVGAEFDIAASPPFPVARAVYSPDINDGAGGTGGFLVVWFSVFTKTIHAQVVAYPLGLIGPRQTVTTVGNVTGGFYSVQLGLAYSPVSREFLLAWSDSDAVGSATYVRLALAGTPIAAPVMLSTEPFIPLNSEFATFHNNVDVVWNSVTGEFGIVHLVPGGSHMELALTRVTGNGAIAGRVSLAARESSNNLTLWSAIDVNSTVGNYLVAWVPGLTSGITVISIDPDGAVMNETTIPASFPWGLDLAFSPLSRTFLLAIYEPGTPGSAIQAREISARGVALSSTWLGVTDGNFMARLATLG